MEAVITKENRVANMPGAVSMTSTIALTNATLPYAIEIVEKGAKRAALDNPETAQGINVIDGKVTYRGVAEAFGLKYTPIEKVLGAKKGK
jgi:alanine dehydrogenase